MSISKIELNAIASKLEMVKEIDKNSQVEGSSAVESGKEVKAVQLFKVEFSDNAKILLEAIEAVKNAPDVRLDKITALKAAIEDGTYKIDSVQVADKLLKAHLADFE